MIASGPRNILSGTEYIKFFPGANLSNKSEVVLDMGDVFDTIIEMQGVVSKTLAETRGIAKTLKGNSLQDTCRKVWNFCYNYFQYKVDNAGVEQLRTPARSWADRKEGIDCDDYSILAASILTNLNIPCYFRMAKYNGKDYYQHIYVVVPKAPGLSMNEKANYYIIDPVVDQFNYEVPFSGKHDKKVIMPSNLNGLSGIPVHVLSGIPAGETSPAQQALFLLKAMLINRVKGLKAKAKKGEADKILITRTEYLLANFDNPESRKVALDHLIRVEEEEAGLSGLGGGLWDAVKQAANWVSETSQDTVRHAINAFVVPVGTIVGKDWGYSTGDFNRDVFKWADETTEDAWKYQINASLAPIGAIAGKDWGYSDGDFNRQIFQWANEKTQMAAPFLADAFLSIFGADNLIDGNPYLNNGKDEPKPAPEEETPDPGIDASIPPPLLNDNKKMLMAGGAGLLFLLLLLGSGGKPLVAEAGKAKTKKGAKVEKKDPQAKKPEPKKQPTNAVRKNK